MGHRVGLRGTARLVTVGLVAAAVPGAGAGARPAVGADVAVGPSVGAAVVAGVLVGEARAAWVPAVREVPGGGRAEAGGPPAAATRWTWPLQPVPAVARPFRAPASDWGAGHRGLDLTSGSGAEVLAVEGGVVSHVGVIAGRGTLSVRHTDGLVSTYEPLAAVVATGDPVVAGQVVGVLAPSESGSHCAPRACLHLGARRGTAYLDPWPLLVRGRLALLPLPRSGTSP